MSDAPEVIWLDAYRNVVTSSPPPYLSRYVRADLHEAVTRERDEARETIADLRRQLAAIPALPSREKMIAAVAAVMFDHEGTTVLFKTNRAVDAILGMLKGGAK